MRSYRFSIVAGLAAIVAIVGCMTHPDGTAPSAAQDAAGKKEEPKPATDVKRKEIFKNIVLETAGDMRRVRINAEVCLRQGMLEQLLTRKRTKEHEAILAADVDARDIHTALILAGAEAGKPVQFRPTYQPASGSVIDLDWSMRNRKHEGLVRLISAV